MKKTLLLGIAALLCGSIAIAQPRSASAPQLLLSTPTGLMAPVWSPDGKHIAASGLNYSGIYVAQADGSSLQMVTDAPGAGYKMVWNGNNAIVGRTNIVENGRVMHEMYSWTLSGTATRVAAKGRNVQAPSLRAAGMAKGQAGIYDMMVADPSHVAATVGALADFEGQIIINPALSPDGSRIAFQVPGKGMWVIGADGSNLRSIGAGSHPAWLPDNATIVYTVVKDNGSEFTSSAIYAKNIDNGKSMTISDSSTILPLSPAVSPDGYKVAFENARDNAIYVITLKY